MSRAEARRSSLTVLRGGGEPSPRPTPALEVVPATSPLPPQQMELPGLLVHPATLVSVGIDGLEFDDFVHILRQNGIRQLADIRVSPSFYGRGFSREGVSSLLAELGVHYEHMRQLGNRFIGDSWDQRVVLQRFSEHVRSSQEALRHLRDKVRAGPVLLLGRGRAHEQSERAVVTKALAELDSQFTLVALDQLPGRS